MFLGWARGAPQNDPVTQCPQYSIPSFPTLSPKGHKRTPARDAVGTSKVSSWELRKVGDRRHQHESGAKAHFSWGLLHTHFSLPFLTLLGMLPAGLLCTEKLPKWPLIFCLSCSTGQPRTPGRCALAKAQLSHSINTEADWVGTVFS